MHKTPPINITESSQNNKEYFVQTKSRISNFIFGALAGLIGLLLVLIGLFGLVLSGSMSFFSSICVMVLGMLLLWGSKHSLAKSSNTTGFIVTNDAGFSYRSQFFSWSDIQKYQLLKFRRQGIQLVQLHFWLNSDAQKFVYAKKILPSNKIIDIKDLSTPYEELIEDFDYYTGLLTKASQETNN